MEKKTLEKNFRERFAVLQQETTQKESGWMEKTAKKAHMSRRALAALVVALTLVLLAVGFIARTLVYQRQRK